MKSPTRLCVALFGSWCWFIASVTLAATPRNDFLNDDTPPAGDTAQPTGSCQEDGACSPAICVVDCCCYRWQVWANALFLTRAGGDDLSLAFGDPSAPKGSEVFGSDDLEFGFAWGPNVGVARCLDPCTSIGVEFFAIDGWSTEGQADGNISVQFPSFPYLPDGGYGLARFRYESYLYNTEVNLRRRASCANWLTMLAGFRWIELGEEFGTVFETGGASPNYLIDVNNHLYGFQLGALANFKNCGPWFLDGWLKAGLYGNSADQETEEDFTSAGGEVAYATARDSNVAFASDVGVSVGRHITDRLTARLGYMALWIEGVALAPDQLDNSDPSSGVASLDNSGSVFYHGGFVGLEYLW